MTRAWVLLLAGAIGCAQTDGATEPSAEEGDGGSSGTAGTVSQGGSDAGGNGGSDASALADSGLAPEVLADGVAAPNDPRILYYGRWSWADRTRPEASWGPVGLVMEIESTTLVVRLEDSRPDLGVEGVGNVYQYRIDDGAFTILPAATDSDYAIAGLTAGRHRFELVRRTESKWGTTTVLGFDLARGATLYDAGPAPSRRLEVLGDSISAGLANENTGLYTNGTENGYLAWGPELARRFGAEWHIEARGGGTFYSDTWLPMPPYFDRTFGPANLENAPAADNPTWSFAAWKPDVFVLALGTNDFSDQYPDIDQTLYTDKYQAFLTDLRTDYPKAEIFCLAPFKQGTPWDEARKYIPLAVAAMNDAHVHAIDPVGAATDLWLTYPADYVKGDQYHPNIAGHKKIADRMEAIVRPVMGW